MTSPTGAGSDGERSGGGTPPISAPTGDDASTLPGPAGTAEPRADDAAGVPDDEEPTRGPVSRLVRNKRFVKLVGAVILFALLYYALFVVLPQSIDWDEVWAALTALTAGQVLTLALSGVLVMVLLGWAAKASLPGLRLYQGFESSATSQMTAFVIPPPGDYVIRFAMYRTYGFTDEQSGISVIIAMVLRYIAIFTMPVFGLAAVLLAGQGQEDTVWWFLGYTAVLGAIVYLFRRVVQSDVTARAVGRGVSRFVSWVMHIFNRTPSKDLEQEVVDFGRRTRGTAETNRRSLLAANLSWALSNALVMGLALRFSGLDTSVLSAAEILLATSLIMAVNVLPIPGINAIIVPQLSSFLGLTSETEESELAAALTLYRVTTWILPMMIGAVMFFVWRFRVRRDTVTTVNEDADDDAGAEPAGSNDQAATRPSET